MKGRFRNRFNLDPVDWRIESSGYVSYNRRARDGSLIKEHTIIVENLMRIKLPKAAIIHHINENRSDNRLCNLAVLPNHSYHALIHRRIRAKKSCGVPSFLRCYYCKEYDHPNNIKVAGNDSFHTKCRNKYKIYNYGAGVSG